MNTDCPRCHHRFVYEDEPEICMGAVQCPRCALVLTQEAADYSSAHLTGPWSGVAWHGKRISRSPTYRERGEAEKWVRAQRKRFHPRHWMRSTLLHKGFLHQVNPNQRGVRRIESAEKVVSALLDS